MTTNAPTADKVTDTEAEVELTDNEKYRVLANERRRLALAILIDHGGMSKSELGERVAAREHNTSRRELSSGERKATLVSLHQNHLQKLADAGAVIWDNDGDDHVYRGPTLDAFAEHVPTTASGGECGRVARAARALGL